MARRGIKKMGAVLIAAGLSIAMCSPSVSANVRTNINTDKITQKKTHSSPSYRYFPFPLESAEFDKSQYHSKSHVFS